MHDDVTNAQTAQSTICKANECVERKNWGPFFDNFWNECEIAVMFGPPGVGKSVLAVQIADALASGTPMDGFVMPEDRRRVLYVDLKLTQGQFAERYTYEPDMETSRRFHHSGNLYIGCPPDPAKLCEFLREAVAEMHITTVIIDDVSELRSTYDGTRETLAVMRQLRRLQRELGLSVLVIASSREPGRTGMVRESDLMRSRVLCEAADSAFAMGVHPHDPAWRYLLQTRSRTGALEYTGENLPFCRMQRSDDGNLAFVFDERFVSQFAEDERLEIIEIKRRRDAGATFRQIADEMSAPVTRVYRLSKKWRPELEFVEDAETAPEHEEELQAEAPEPVGDPEPGPVPAAEETVEPEVQNAVLEELSPLRDNWPEWINRRLKREIDDRDREILVKTYDERGRPKVYYTVSSKGRVTRWLRDDWGCSGSTQHPPRPTGAGAYLAQRLGMRKPARE